MKTKHITACTIQRIVRRSHFTLGFNTGETKSAGPDTVATEACNIPLFTEEARTSGICKGCRNGWELEGNRFASDAERERAMRDFGDCRKSKVHTTDGVVTGTKQVAGMTLEVMHCKHCGIEITRSIETRA